VREGGVGMRISAWGWCDSSVRPWINVEPGSGTSIALCAKIPALEADGVTVFQENRLVPPWSSMENRSQSDIQAVYPKPVRDINTQTKLREGACILIHWASRRHILDRYENAQL